MQEYFFYLHALSRAPAVAAISWLLYNKYLKGIPVYTLAPRQLTVNLDAPPEMLLRTQIEEVYAALEPAAHPPLELTIGVSTYVEHADQIAFTSALNSADSEAMDNILDELLASGRTSEHRYFTWQRYRAAGVLAAEQAPVEVSVQPLETATKLGATVFLLMGMPGSGKGTEAKQLEPLGYTPVSTGELLRQHANEAQQARMAAGEVLAGHEVYDLLEQALAAFDAEATLILDGFPRDIEQAAWLCQRIRRGTLRLGTIFNIVVDAETATKRALGRNEDRPDDNPETIAARLKQYETKTRPILAYLAEQGYTVHEIDGSEPPAVVHRQVLGALGIAGANDAQIPKIPEATRAAPPESPRHSRFVSFIRRLLRPSPSLATSGLLATSFSYNHARRVAPPVI